MRAVLPVASPPDYVPRLGELPDPRPGAGEVALQVRATALNHADLLQLRGLYPPPPGETPVPGLEAAGVVVEVGEGVTGWHPGDRVMALLAGGGHGTRVVAPAGQLMPLPPGWNFAAGGALPEAALTAWTNLVAEGCLAPGETVLVTGANGGMGSFMVELAARRGARVIAAGRSRERLEPLAGRGAAVLVELGEDLPRAVLAATDGRGVDLVVDLVGGEHVARGLEALAEQGRLVLVGLLAGRRADLDLGDLLRRRLTLMGSVLRSRPREEKARLVADYLAFAAPLMAAGALKPRIDATFPFDRITDAYEALRVGGVGGKIAVLME